MSLEFVDGFDHYSSSNMSQKGWVNPTGTLFSPGRFGGNAWSSFNNGNATRIMPSGSLSSRVIGFALNPGGNINSVATGINDFFRVLDSAGALSTATTQLQFGISSGQVTVYRGVNGSGGTLLGTSSGGPTIMAGLWYYIEIKVTIDNTAGSVQIRISDGASSTTILSLSGLDTQNTANATFDTISLLQVTGSPGSNGYDDLYVCTLAGSVNNTFLGEVRVQTIYPTSDGHSTQWTPNSGANNFSRVNETLVDDDTSFVSSATPGQIDTYNHGALVSAGAILGVQTNITARKDDVGSRSIAADVYDGTTDFVNSNAHGLLSSYQDFTDIYETDPSTGLPWTAANFNARQFGVLMVS